MQPQPQYAQPQYAQPVYAPQQYQAQQPQYVAMAPGQQQMVMVPQPAVMAVPAGYVLQQVLAPDLLSSFGRLKGAFVKQKVEVLEVVTGCETKNKYRVSAWDPQMGAVKPKDGVGEELYKFKERSECFERLICGSYRSFEMAMYSDTPKIGTHRSGGDPLSYPDAVVMERPFKCTCLCLARPVIHVKHNTLGYMATVRNPFAVCSRQFTVGPPQDDGNLHGPIADAVKGQASAWYRVHGSIWQPAFWCSLPCGECSKLRFEIYDAADTHMTTPIGHLARVFPGWLKSCFTDADNYTLEFPLNATPIQKASLTATTILLDMTMFEQNGSQQNGDSAGGLIGGLLRAVL